MRKYTGQELGYLPQNRISHPALRTLDNLYELLRSCWDKSTTSRSCRTNWIPSNPASGQGLITTVLVHDLFGGEIRFTDVKGKDHFFNVIDDRVVDLTSEQFDLYSIPVQYFPSRTISRRSCASLPDLAEPYEKLIEAVCRKTGLESEQFYALDHRHR